jgi:hypothetical protein
VGRQYYAVHILNEEDEHMNSMKRSLFGFVLTAVLFAFAIPQMGIAQDQVQDQSPAQGDPPGRVARLDYSNGSVSFQPGGEGDWVQAVNNRPLTTGITCGPIRIRAQSYSLVLRPFA